MKALEEESVQRYVQTCKDQLKVRYIPSLPRIGQMAPQAESCQNSLLMHSCKGKKAWHRRFGQSKRPKSTLGHSGRVCQCSAVSELS